MRAQHQTQSPVAGDASKSLELLRDAREIARERGGKVLAEHVQNSLSRLLWQCAQGRRWKARLAKVKGGTWCPACAGRQVLTIRDMRKLAMERGGRCLSAKYVNNATPLEWRCSQHHV